MEPFPNDSKGRIAGMRPVIVYAIIIGLAAIGVQAGARAVGSRMTYNAQMIESANSLY